MTVGLERAFERVGATTERVLEVSHAAGMALAITDREEILGAVCRGMADVAARTPVRPETRFQIGSISKSFASLVVLQEAEAGRLALDVSVNELVPWLGLPEPFGPITLHDLMTHTSGLLVGTEDAPTAAGVMWRLRTNPPTTAPGERFLYSNDGWKVVGVVLEEVTGTPAHVLLEERVLRPLGMRSSVAAITDRESADQAVGYEPLFSDRPVQLRHPLVPAPRIVSHTVDGSIISTVVDLAAYARMVLAGGDVEDGRGGRILSENAFARWIEPRVEDDEGSRYGYGWWTEEVDGVRWVWHSGGMVGSTGLLVVAPDEGLAFASLKNGAGRSWEVARTAIHAVRATLAGEALPEPWSPPAAIAIPAAADYVGRYAGDDGRELILDAVDGGLLLSVGSVRVSLERDPLTEPTDVFVIPHDALERYPLEFGRDDDGAVVEAFHGPTWFRGERFAGPEPEPLPPAWERLVGLYRNDDPWAAALRILPRKGGLVLQWPAAATDEDGQSAPLVPLEDSGFAVGAVRDPRRIRFTGEGAGGAAVVAEFNGGSWFRAPED